MQSLPFIPYRQDPIFVPVQKLSTNEIFSFTKPYLFHMLTEEGLAAMFLRTVASDVEQARAFVSKNSPLDLDALQSIVVESAPLMVGLQKASSKLENKIKTRSILLDSCILHLHMVKEPDQHGQWKIYGVDKESR